MKPNENSHAEEFQIELIDPSESALKAIFGKTDVRTGEKFQPLEKVELTCTTPPSRGFLEHHPVIVMIVSTIGEEALKASIKWLGGIIKNGIGKLKVNGIEIDADEIGIEVALKITLNKNKQVEDKSGEEQ